MKPTRRTITALSIVLLAVTIMSVSALGQNAYAAHDLQEELGSGLSLHAEGSGSTVTVSGTTDRNDLDVTFKLSSSKAIHSIGQTSVSGGSFSTSFNVNNLDDGTYTITATQSISGKQSATYNLSVDIDVSDGTSTSSVSISNRVSHDDNLRVSSDNLPTATSFQKLTIAASGIEGSNTINVSGTTDRSIEIIVKVLAPNGNLISVDQITPSDGSYTTTIKTGGPLWSQDGMYKITATQTPQGLDTHSDSYDSAADSPNAGLIYYQASAEVEIVDGHVIPEFGVIAAMILAIAIVSIIVVTAKTKLSLVPRY